MYDSVVSGNFTLGNGADGGGIFTGSGSTIVRSTIVNNHTFGNSADGGGVYGRLLTIEDSNVIGNGTFGEGADGGGIATDRATIVRSTVGDNLTSGREAKGGGIYSRLALAVVESTMSGNRTIGEQAAGGGIWVYRELDVTTSTISGNSTAGVGADGGGIAVPQTGDKSIVQSTITENRALNSDAGGVWIGVGPLTLVDSVIAGNFAAGENADLRIDDVGMAAAILQGELEEEASEQVDFGIQSETWLSGFGPSSADESLGRTPRRLPADMEAGNSAGAGGRVRVAAASRDLALVAWRAGLERRGEQPGLSVHEWEIERGWDDEELSFADVDAAIELLADNVPALNTR
jgi:hypothetical protein